MKDRYKADLIFDDEDNAFMAISKEAGAANGGRGLLNIIESKIINKLSEFTFLNEDDLIGRTVVIKQRIPDSTRFTFEIR